MNSRPFARRAHDPDPPAMRVDDALGDVEAQSAAAAIAILLLPVTIKSVRQVLGGDARARVRHGEMHLAGELLGHDRDGSTIGAELDRVADGFENTRRMRSRSQSTASCRDGASGQSRIDFSVAAGLNMSTAELTSDATSSGFPAVRRTPASIFEASSRSEMSRIMRSDARSIRAASSAARPSPQVFRKSSVAIRMACAPDVRSFVRALDDVLGEAQPGR